MEKDSQRPQKHQMRQLRRLEVLIDVVYVIVIWRGYSR